MSDAASQPTPPVRCIVSGGQTGVDRAALDAALALGIDHGGWCPRGRKAEDGAIAPRYRLRETRSSKYHVRTRKNVLGSDATLILHRGELVGGTELTWRFAQERQKPHLLIDVQNVAEPAFVRKWLCEEGVETLNVAGPRESTAPGIYEQALEFLLEVFRGPL